MPYNYSRDHSTFIALSELQLAVLLELVADARRRKDLQKLPDTLALLDKLATQLRTGLAAIVIVRAEEAHDA